MREWLSSRLQNDGCRFESGQCLVKHVENILGGLGIFLVIIAILVAIFGTGNLIAHDNNQKQQRMNELCINKGYSGWQSGTNNNNNYGISGCVK